MDACGGNRLFKLAVFPKKEDFKNKFFKSSKDLRMIEAYYCPDSNIIIKYASSPTLAQKSVKKLKIAMDKLRWSMELLPQKIFRLEPWFWQKYKIHSSKGIRKLEMYNWIKIQQP